MASMKSIILAIVNEWGDQVEKACGWCECNHAESTEAILDGMVFAEDGKCPCGIKQHHYHCPKCRKITQVG